MDLSALMLLYCERPGPGLWDEPLNALSNLGFFWFAWRLHGAAGAAEARLVRPLRWLALLIALVGAGSLSFHVFAERWANILDIGFIGLFNLAYVFAFLRLVARWSRTRALAAAGSFLLLDRTAAALLPPGLLNGSGFYLPATATLVLLTAYALRIAPEVGRRMLLAALVFAIALAARTLDRSLCDVWPWGTHFVWHLLCAWVLFRLAGSLRQAGGDRLQRASA